MAVRLNVTELRTTWGLHGGIEDEVYHNVITESRSAPTQWETVLFCNGVSYLLGTSLDSALSIDRHRLILHNTNNAQKLDRQTALVLSGNNSAVTASVESLDNKCKICVPYLLSRGGSNCAHASPLFI